MVPAVRRRIHLAWTVAWACLGSARLKGRGDEVTPSFFVDPDGLFYEKRRDIGYGYGNGSLFFKNPTFVAVLPNGELCVADSQNHRIQVMSSKGKMRRYFGDFGAAPGDFYSPAGVAGDVDALYVSDSLNHRVQKLSHGGAPLATAGSFGSGLDGLNVPQGLALYNDSVFVADSWNHRIVVYDSRLQVQYAFGSRGSSLGLLSFPSGVAVRADLLHVVDTGNDRIQVFTLQGAIVRSVGVTGTKLGQFVYPADLAFARGRWFVSEFYGQRVQVLTEDWAPLTVVKAVSAGKLGGIAASPANVYVADLDQHIVHVLAVRALTPSELNKTRLAVLNQRQDPRAKQRHREGHRHRAALKRNRTLSMLHTRATDRHDITTRSDAGADEQEEDDETG